MESPRSFNFTPWAWAKVCYTMTLSPDEVSGFAITDPDNPQRITDFALVKQTVSAAYTEMDDEGIADYVQEQITQGREIKDFFRIWIHTHPSGVTSPSTTDEETFRRVFGDCPWSVMVIVPRGHRAIGVVQYGVGPGGQNKIDVGIDWTAQFPATQHGEWKEEFTRLVQKHVCKPKRTPRTSEGNIVWLPRDDSPGPRLSSYPCFGEYEADHIECSKCIMEGPCKSYTSWESISEKTKRGEEDVAELSSNPIWYECLQCGHGQENAGEEIVCTFCGATGQWEICHDDDILPCPESNRFIEDHPSCKACALREDCRLQTALEKAEESHEK